jgi:hypothetical protein
MMMLISVFRGLFGLFVDDGALALAIVVVVAIAGGCELLVPGAMWMRGAILLFGCFGVLLLNVMTARRD